MRGRSGVLDPAPPRAPRDGDGRGGWVWLVTARNVFEAELLRGLLDNAGVPAVLDGFDRSPFAWMYPAGNVQAPVQIFVPASLLEAARLELLESSVVASDRLESGSPATPGARLLRDRVKPVWLVVALLTSLTAGWLVVVEVLRFAPCSARIFCIERSGVSPTVERP